MIENVPTNVSVNDATYIVRDKEGKPIYLLCYRNVLYCNIIRLMRGFDHISLMDDGKSLIVFNQYLCTAIFDTKRTTGITFDFPGEDKNENGKYTTHRNGPNHTEYLAMKLSDITEKFILPIPLILYILGKYIMPESEDYLLRIFDDNGHPYDQSMITKSMVYIEEKYTITKVTKEFDMYRCD